MPRGNTFRTWDDYFIPGTSVLRNKFTGPGKPYGEPDPDKLRLMEEAFAHTRIQELHDNPIEGRFDYDHMKAIHRAIFQDVYEWAGQERVAPVGQFMTKDGHAYYGAGPHLTAAAEAEYAKLTSKNLLRGLEPAEFVDQLAESWGEVNVIHFAREGNTRAQFVFFSQLAEQAGYRIDAAQFAPGAPLRDEFVQARFHSQDTGRNDRLAAVLGQAITPFDRGPQAVQPGAERGSGLWRASYPQAATEATRQPPPASGLQARGSGTYRTGRDAEATRSEGRT